MKRGAYQPRLLHHPRRISNTLPTSQCLKTSRKVVLKHGPSRTLDPNEVHTPARLGALALARQCSPTPCHQLFARKHRNSRHVQAHRSTKPAAAAKRCGCSVTGMAKSRQAPLQPSSAPAVPAVRGAGTSRCSGQRMTCLMQVGAYSTQQVLPEMMLCNGILRDVVYLGAWRVGNPIAPCCKRRKRND